MPYFISLLSCIFILASQYFLSHWLIKIGWFYGYVWVVGGFIVIFFTFFAIASNLFKLFKLNINKADIPVKTFLVLTLLGSFWLNIELDRFHQKYEYETFGIKAKAVISRKYELQSKGHSYILLLKVQDKTQQKELEYSVSSESYKSRKIGDTLTVFYTPRYATMFKVIPKKK